VILSAEQQLRVAVIYEGAAEDASVPPPVRAAFARKAKRFRMRAQAAAQIESTTVVRRAPILEPRQENVPEDFASAPSWKPQPAYLTLAERLKIARAASEEAEALQARQRNLGALAVQKDPGGRQALSMRPMQLVILVAVVALTAGLLGCAGSYRTAGGAAVGGAAGVVGGGLLAGPIGAIAGGAAGAATGAALSAPAPREEYLR
jgi:hypothetical protein